MQYLWPRVAGCVSDRQAPTSLGGTTIHHLHRPQGAHIRLQERIQQTLTKGDAAAGLHRPDHVEVLHVKGERNIVADTLSRTEVSAITTVDLQEIARHQPAELSLRTDMPSLKTVEVPLPFIHGNIWVDTSTGTQRPLVPQNLCRKVFLSLHSLSHPGARATSKMIRQRFVWPHMDKDIRAWCQECLSCQKGKVHRHTSTAPASFPLSSCHFQHIHMDLVGPLPASNGHTHILMIIDRFTSWPVAIPLTDTSTETVLRSLISGWVANLGVPETITTDRGSQFSSHLFHQAERLSHFLRTLSVSLDSYLHSCSLQTMWFPFKWCSFCGLCLCE